MLKVVHDAEASNENTAGGSLLDEIVRDGARQMLAAALQAEVAAYIEQFSNELDENGLRLVVRNGHHEPREVTTAAGAIPVRAPRVNDKRMDEATGERQRFSSAILPAWARKSPAWPRCCRCCTCTACPRVTSCRRWSSSSALPRACPPRPSPGSRSVARRRQGVRQAVVEGHRLRVPVGRRYPPQGPPGAGQGVPAGDDRGPRRRQEGADRSR
jgi:hypothetical protein